MKGINMNINEYQKLTHTTAIYPVENDADLYYVTFGLINEIGEIIGKHKKVIRDKNSIYGASELKEVSKEIGDAYWYISEECTIFLIPLNEIIVGDEIIIIKCFDLNQMILTLSQGIGALSYDINTMLKFNYTRISYQCNIKTSLKFIHNQLSNICHFLDLNIDEILFENIEKLRSRKERGVLKGSGDNR